MPDVWFILVLILFDFDGFIDIFFVEIDFFLAIDFVFKSWFQLAYGNLFVNVCLKRTIFH